MTVTLAQKIPRDQIIAQLNQACDSITLVKGSILSDARKLVREGGPEEAKFASEISLLANASAAKALGDSPAAKDYTEQIEKLKGIADPTERMRLAYALAQRYQGRYMDPEARKKEKGFPTPGRTLERAAQTGEGGVCRDFASLLVWSLNQLAQNKSGQSDFRATFEDMPNHAVVKVTMDQGSSRFLGRSFQLDPTNQKVFTPLPTSMVFDSDQLIRGKQQTCDEAAACFESEGLMIPPSAATKASGSGAGVGAWTGPGER